jgi:hypothetical protein
MPLSLSYSRAQPLLAMARPGSPGRLLEQARGSKSKKIRIGTDLDPRERGMRNGEKSGDDREQLAWSLARENLSFPVFL